MCSSNTCFISFDVCIFGGLEDVLMCSHVVVLLMFPDCVSSNGVDYRGEQQSSSSGLTCLNWINATRDYDLDIHPDSQTGTKKKVFSFSGKKTNLLNQTEDGTLRFKM